MSKNKLITIALLFGCLAILIGWDLYVYVAGENVDMITAVVWNTSTEHPVLPFSVGVICGHLFWGKGDNAKTR